LEDDKKMTRPKTREAAVTPGRTAYLVGRLDRALRRHLAETVGPLGLTVPQYTALSVLHSRGQLSNARLAECSFMTPQAANEMVKVMEGKRWVSRQPDPSHGRIVLIRLTSQGEKLLARGDEAVARLEEALLRTLSAKDRATLYRTLKTCMRNLGAILAEG
jgi:DNA-binding MarR family transcriptional regulator